MGCNNDPYTYAVIETEFGDMKVKLYNTTPLHRDNFIKLANEGFYDGLLFHRVINNFMIQGGDPDSRTATPEQGLGMGGPGYRVDAEIGALHLKGALAAARDGNPQKRSSGSQFYIVHGRPVTDAELDQVEQMRNFTYTPEQRQLYKELGGYPSLDGDYTVFGEVVEGIDVIDRIAAVPTGQANRPVQDVRMNVRVLK
jgi:peptidyl-prolyl cis-trans isomerase B (cyclophilin B)